MDDVFVKIAENLKLTGHLKEDTYKFLIDNKRFIIAEHSLRVAEKAKLIARRYKLDEKSAETAGMLHDIGGVYANDERIEVCKTLGIDILPQEEILPLILHQKISQVMAREIFNIQSEDILVAIGCHTTLRANASLMDMVLFVADKLEWDQQGRPPFADLVEEGLKSSLEGAAYAYIKYLFDNRENLKVVHPWLEAAYEVLKERIKG